MTDAYELKLADQQTLLQIGMVLYPGLTMLDLIGPQNVLSTYAVTHLLWKTRDLVTSDSGFLSSQLRPSATVPITWISCSCPAARAPRTPWRTRRFFSF